VKAPNVVFVFGDQWRAQAAGYAGNTTVRTPHLDRLAGGSINAVNAVAGCPVCSPYRASLLTGQYPLTHGVFVNDVGIRPDSVSLATAFAGAGYDTAYIGKWHVDGRGRTSVTPRERRLGFDYWKAVECTHRYNESVYYDGDAPEPRTWDGYDAIAQTRDARRYILDHAGGMPFLLVLSWGPPHAPYGSAPAEFRALYRPDALPLRGNVPDDVADRAREDLAGYYAHCTALDSCMGVLIETIREAGIEDDTLLVFTSDHGDMLGSHGRWKKQQPWDESVRVPFLLRYPARFGRAGRRVDGPVDAPDIMPTLLALSGLEIPGSVEGLDFSEHLEGGADPSGGAAVLMCPHPFGQWSRPRHGGREYRGLRTTRYTYACTLDGPWMLYDNREDPLQLHNRAADPGRAVLRDELDALLRARLSERGDEFLPGDAYIRQWGYRVNKTGTVPYKD
jgi:arylsulfatase A-like enzyme